MRLGTRRAWCGGEERQRARPLVLVRIACMMLLWLQALTRCLICTQLCRCIYETNATRHTPGENLCIETKLPCNRQLVEKDNTRKSEVTRRLQR